MLHSGSFGGDALSLDGSHDFTASNWAGEVYLEKLSKKTGPPVVICRTCSLVKDKAPHDNALNLVIRFSMLSRTIPDIPNIEGYFNFQGASQGAADILKSVGHVNGVTPRHHSSGVK